MPLRIKVMGLHTSRFRFQGVFLTRSSARPQLLFYCQTNSELFFLSSPQPQNLDENSSHVVVDCHMKFSWDFGYYFQTYHPVHGLVCHMRISKVVKETEPVIYNPSTGQSLLLPKIKTRYVGAGVFSLLGYDPIDKQFKLFSMIYGGNNVHEEHRVLTLGTRNHSWRMIKCFRPHYSCNQGICINGVLYYTASENSSLGDSMAVCFDVKSEKFRFIQFSETFVIGGKKHITYNGKLGLLGTKNSCESIELCVLEDAQKHEWSKHTYVLPALWKNIVGNPLLYIVGMTKTNEIVLATSRQTVLSCLYYYNIERKTIIRLQIQGMEAFKSSIVYIFLDHVENLEVI